MNKERESFTGTTRFGGDRYIHKINLNDDCVRVYKNDEGEPVIKYDSNARILVHGKYIGNLRMIFDDRYNCIGYKMVLNDSEEPCCTIDSSWKVRDFTEAEPFFTEYLLSNGLV